MGLWDGIKRQLRSVIEWDSPGSDELFYRWSENGDEIKNASKLIVGPGQGCIFVYEGRIRAVHKNEGMIDLATANIPFWTTIVKALQAFESEHKVGVFFFSKAAILNQKWGTASPIKYDDPKYGFPVGLKAFGNFSLRLADPEGFFRNVVAGKDRYFISDLRDVLNGRIAQSVADALAGAKVSYAEIDAQRDALSADILRRLEPEFGKLGFEASDFRIEGTDFDGETKARIGRVAGTVADAKAAEAAGLSFTEMQRLEAMRDAARNEGGGAGVGMGLGAGIRLGETMADALGGSPPGSKPSGADPAGRLRALDQLLREKLISETEYQAKRKDILSGL